MIHTTDQSKIEACVEAICHKGCRSVRVDIRHLEAGLTVPEVAGFSTAQKAEILAELKAVMAAYADTCTLTSVGFPVDRESRG